MENKKGFTLVELLAVIAILAILVIIALPNILNLYRNARQNVFVEEAQNVLRTAQQKYLQDSLTSTETAPCYSSSETKLDLDAKSTLQYKVKFDANGNVTSIVVKDNNYSLDSGTENNSKKFSGSIKIDTLKQFEVGAASAATDLTCAE